MPLPATDTGERWIDYHWHPLDILPRQGPWLTPCCSASTSLDNLMNLGSPPYSYGCSGKRFTSLGRSFFIWTAMVRIASTNRIPGTVTWGQAHRKWKVQPQHLSGMQDQSYFGLDWNSTLGNITQKQKLLLQNTNIGCEEVVRWGYKCLSLNLYVFSHFL